MKESRRLYVRTAAPGSRCYEPGCDASAVYLVRRTPPLRQGYGYLRCSECTDAIARREGREMVIVTAKAR